MARAAIDHLVYGVAELEPAIADLAGRTGVRPALGGRHVGRGTANALLGLGSPTYLELLGPDPHAEPGGGTELAFGVGQLAQPRLVGWALQTDDLASAADAMRRSGWDPGEIQEMERESVDGTRLQWRLTVRDDGDEIVPFPFLIDWGTTPHPSSSAPQGIRLTELRVEDPQAALVRRVLSAVGSTVQVQEAPLTGFVVRLSTPAGDLVLR